MGDWVQVDGVLHFVVYDQPICGSTGGLKNGVPCPACLRRLLDAVALGFEKSDPWVAA